jgi:hypothetical protein
MESPLGGTVSDRQASAAREKLGEFIGSSLFGMVLSEMRKTTRQEHVLFGGRGEEALQPLLDQALIGKVSSSPNFGLVDAAFERLYINTPYSRLVSPELAVRGGASSVVRETA